MKSKVVVGICYRWVIYYNSRLATKIRIGVAPYDTHFRVVRNPVNQRTLFLSRLVLFAVAKDTSPHHVRRTKRKASTQMEVAVSCVVIHSILQKIVGYEHEASFFFVVGSQRTLSCLAGSMESSAILGTGHEAGADEDDFHIFKRQTTAIDREEKQLEQTRRLLRVESGAQSINANPIGTTPKPPIKVIYF